MPMGNSGSAVSFSGNATALQTVAIDTTLPTDGEGLAYSAAAGKYIPTLAGSYVEPTPHAGLALVSNGTLGGAGYITLAPLAALNATGFSAGQILGYVSGGSLSAITPSWFTFPGGGNSGQYVNGLGSLVTAPWFTAPASPAINKYLTWDGTNFIWKAPLASALDLTGATANQYLGASGFTIPVLGSMSSAGASPKQILQYVAGSNPSWVTVVLTDLSSGAATARKVPLADGAGGISWGVPRATDLDITGATAGYILAYVSGSTPSWVLPPYFTLPTQTGHASQALITDGTTTTYGLLSTSGLDPGAATAGMALLMGSSHLGYGFVDVLGSGISDKLNVRSSRIVQWQDGASQTKAASISDWGTGTTPGTGTGTVTLLTFAMADFTSVSSPTFNVNICVNYGAQHASGSDNSKRSYEAEFKYVAGVLTQIGATSDGADFSDGIGGSLGGAFAISGTSILFRGTDTASGSSTAITHKATGQAICTWP